MVEIWVKKTVYRRYLVEESELEEVETTLKYEPKRAEELIGDIYDKNKEIEYDEEKIVIPVDYSIRDLSV